MLYPIIKQKKNNKKLKSEFIVSGPTHTSHFLLLFCAQLFDMQCSIGNKLKSICSGGLVDQIGLSDQQILLLKLRCNVKIIKTLCLGHRRYYLDSYSERQKNCCNPLNLHKRQHKGIFTINEKLHDTIHKNYVKVIEGRKLCVNCKVYIFNNLDNLTREAEQYQGLFFYRFI